MLKKLNGVPIYPPMNDPYWLAFAASIAEPRNALEMRKMFVMKKEKITPSIIIVLSLSLLNSIPPPFKTSGATLDA